MTIDHRHALASLQALLRAVSPEELRKRLQPKKHAPPPKVVSGSEITPEAIDRRWSGLPSREAGREVLLDGLTVQHAVQYARNVENFVGTVKVPVGVAGPIRVNGTYAQGDYYVPMATLEATLVASYSRGAQLITEAGGCAAATISENVSRAPGYAFASLHEAGQFIAWATGALAQLKEAADATTRYGRVRGMRVSLEGNHVYLIFDFSTGDASGQNMVTIATHAICDYIARECPIKPVYAFLESNHSGDKKASAQSFMSGRGRSVTAEVLVPRDLVQSRLHTTPEMMCRYWAMSAIGGVLSGTIGVQGHYANGLAAIYMACGQDVACVAESAVGVTRIEMAGDDMYVSVTLPNVLVGTVGGGTGLPSQRACLDILGLAGPGNANAFAEVCASIALAGELSIVGALCAGDFAQAHARFARGAAAVAAPASAPGSRA